MASYAGPTDADGAGVGLGVGVLRDVGDLVTLDVDEPAAGEQLFTRAWPAEGDHRRLVFNLRRARHRQWLHRPGARGAFDVTPDGDSQSPTGHEDAVRLGNGVGRRRPDPTKAGDDVERGVGPGKVLHVADAKVGLWVAIAGHGDQPWRCVDAGTRRAHNRRQLHGEPGAAGHVEQTVTWPDPKVMVEGHVLPAVRWLTEGGEVDGAPAPTLVDLVPGRRRVTARRQASAATWPSR